MRRPARLIALAVLTVVALAGCGAAAQTGERVSSQELAAVLLTPASDPATMQTVTWRTERTGLEATATPIDGGRARTAAARIKSATSEANSGSSVPAHTATLTGLRPDTAYDLSIDGETVASFRTAATGLDADAWSFIALGDTQIDNAGLPADIVDRALADAPDARLLLQAGDLIDRPDDGREWEAAMSALEPARTTRSLLVAAGNHEQCVLMRDCRHGDVEGYRAHVTNPGNDVPGQRPTWFALDHQGVRFVVLDSFGPDPDAQARFLDDALATNEQPWSVVLMHASPFASRAKRTNTQVAATVLPVLERHDVDLVLTGHDHVYSRGYRGDPDGTVYVTANSGPKFYPMSRADWDRRGATRARAAEQVATYQVVEVDATRLRYRAVVAGLGDYAGSEHAVGDVLDELTIARDEHGDRTVTW